MNKKIVFILILVFCLFLVGCAGNKPISKKEEITDKFQIEKIIKEYSKSVNGSFVYRYGYSFESGSQNTSNEIIYNKENNCLSFTCLNFYKEIDDYARKVKCYIQFDEKLDKYIYTNSLTKTYRISDASDIFGVFEEIFECSINDYIAKDADDLFRIGNDDTYTFVKYNGYKINISNSLMESYIEYEIKETNLKPIDISEYVLHPFQD